MSLTRVGLALLASAAACAPDVPAGGGSVGGAGQAQSGPANAAAAQGFCQGAVAAFCDTLAACGGMSSAATCVGGVFGAKLHANCQDLLEDRLVGLATGHLTLDVSALQQCRARMKALCGGEIDAWCLGAMRPAASLGQACWPPFGCQQGACVEQEGQTGRGSCAFGKCTALQAGDKCSKWFECGASFACGPGNACVARIPAGGACSDKAYWCAAGLACQQGVCAAESPPPPCPNAPGEGCLWLGEKCAVGPPRRPGEPSWTGDCYHEFLLLVGKGGACGGEATRSKGVRILRTCRLEFVCDPESETCKEPSALGAPCKGAFSCGPSALCINGKCSALAASGQPCAGACAPGAVCIAESKTCVPLTALGHGCASDSQCMLGKCVAGKCTIQGCLAGG